MLILVAVTVSYGIKSGLLSKSKDATSDYTYQEEEDEIGQIRNSYLVDTQTAGMQDSQETLKNYLSEELTGEASVEVSGEYVIVTYNETKNQHKIKKEQDKVTTLKGTTWQFNDKIADYSFFPEFNYSQQTGWFDIGVREKTIASNETAMDSKVVGITQCEFYGNYLFSFVTTNDISFIWIPEENDLDMESGWIAIDPYTPFISASKTEAVAIAKNSYTTAPTVEFLDIEGEDATNKDLIDWMYASATLISVSE